MGVFRCLVVVVLYFAESATSCIFSQELKSSPFAVIFSNGNVDQRLRSELKRAKDELLGEAPSTDSTVQGNGVFRELLRHYPDFKFSYGNARFSTTDGTFAGCMFITIPDQAAFDWFVELERSNRRSDGSARLIDEGEGKVRIVASPDSTMRDGTRVNTTYGDLHYRYTNGLLCYGKKQIFEMNMADIARLIPDAEDHDAYWSFIPQNLTVATRGIYLDAVQAGINVRMQDFDNESIEAHAVRKTALKIQSLFLNGFFDDVEHVTFRIQCPRDSEPYHIRCHVKIREASPLATFVAELSQSHQISGEFPKSSVAKCGISIGLPTELKDFLRAIVLFDLSNNTLRSVFLPTIEEGVINAHMCLYTDERGFPSLQLTSPVAVKSQSVAETAVTLSSLFAMIPDLEFLVPYSNYSQEPILREYRLVAEIQEHSLKMTVANQSIAERKVHENQVDNDDVVAMNVTSLMDLEWDFSPWISTEQESAERAFVNALERLYVQSEVDNHPSIRMRKYLPRATYKPVASTAKRHGDWSGSFSVRANSSGDAVVIDFRAGAELFHLYKARQTLNERALKSVRFPAAPNTAVN